MQQAPATDRMVQYRIAADHRLHFGRLFFQVTAFNLAFALALYVAVAGSVGVAAGAALSGGVLIGTAAVAGRLLRQERLYATAMAAIETVHEGLLSLEPPQGGGARSATVLGLAMVGAVLTTCGLLRM